MKFLAMYYTAHIQTNHEMQLHIKTQSHPSNNMSWLTEPLILFSDISANWNFPVQQRNALSAGRRSIPNCRRRHESDSEVTVRRLGRIIQRIFSPQSGASIRRAVWKWSGETRFTMGSCHFF